MEEGEMDDDDDEEEEEEEEDNGQDEKFVTVTLSASQSAESSPKMVIEPIWSASRPKIKDVKMLMR